MIKIKRVFAHCDGPCGHYETDTLKNGAMTCLKLMKKISELKPDNQQDYIRLIMLKEEHAQLCKQQVYILWSDFFKAHHYEKYTNLHSVLYLLAQQCSLVKQTLDVAVAQELIDSVAKLDKIFQEVSNASS